MPRLVQLGYILNKDGEHLEQREFIIQPDGFTIPDEVSAIHGITTERAKTDGVFIEWVIPYFRDWLMLADVVVGHNIEFDLNVMGAEFIRLGKGNPFENRQS